MIYTITITLAILAALSNAVMDVLKDHFDTSVFKNKNRVFWDPRISWMNKWIDGDKTKGRTYWFVKGVKIVKPAMITDAWHIFKALMLVFLGTAFGLLTPHFLGLPIFFICWYLGFEVPYSKILRG
jgi:hypothetical protein